MYTNRAPVLFNWGKLVKVNWEDLSTTGTRIGQLKTLRGIV